MRVRRGDDRLRLGQVLALEMYKRWVSVLHLEAVHLFSKYEKPHQSRGSSALAGNACSGDCVY